MSAGMRLRAAFFGSTATHYVLAYAVGLPIFLLFVVARRLLRRRREVRGRRATA
jgi:hypothetical protein